MILALQLQDGALPASSGGLDVIALIQHASLPTTAVIVALLVFSILSWAVILVKALAFRSVDRQSKTFIDVFRRSTKFSEVQAVCGSLGGSPLVGMFQAGYAE